MKCTLTRQTDYIGLRMLFYREELVYDIRNLAYIESHGVPDEVPHPKHQVADIGEMGNADRLYRILNLKYYECVEALHRYSHSALRNGEEVDDRPSEDGNYLMELRVPETFSQTTAHYLSELIHEYLVCSTVADWLGMVYPDKLPIWLQRAEQAKVNMNKVLGHRTRRVRRLQHWLT